MYKSLPDALEVYVILHNQLNANMHWIFPLFENCKVIWQLPETKMCKMVIIMNAWKISKFEIVQVNCCENFM